MRAHGETVFNFEIRRVLALALTLTLSLRERGPERMPQQVKVTLPGTIALHSTALRPTVAASIPQAPWMSRPPL